MLVPCLHIIITIIRKSHTKRIEDLNVKNVFSELLSVNVYTKG